MYWYFCENIEFTQHSTGLSLGNLVDGLLGASHNTEALWGSQGVFGPAAIDTMDKKQIVNIWNPKFNFPHV